MPDTLNRKFIIAHTGEDSFYRGQDYFKHGSVKKVKLDENRHTISGKVSGNSYDPYEVDIDLDTERGGIADSWCSCPMETACKHVAALALEALEIFPHQLSDSVQTAKSSKATWQTIFEPLAAEHRDSAAATHHQAEVVLTMAQEQGWDSGLPVWKLKARLRTVDIRTGKQSLTMLQWKDLRGSQSYKLEIAPISPKAKLWLVEFFRNLVAADYYGGYAAPASWLSLGSSKHTAEIWALLKRHREAGIRLVFGEDPSQEVVVSDSPVKPVALIEDSGKHLTVRREIVWQGNAVAATTVIFLGTPPVFVFLALPAGAAALGMPSFGLYPVEGQHNSQMLDKLAAPVNIPEKDIPAFVRDYLPHLAKASEILNRSQKISVPEFFSPKLTVNVERAGEYSIAAKFSWQYGGRTVPLSDETPDATRDTDAEVPIERAASRVLGTSIPESVTLEKLAAGNFMNVTVPQLSAMPDVVVTVADDVPKFKIIGEAPLLDMAVEESSSAGETDWFDLRLEITVGEHRVAIADLLVALKSDDEYLFLENGAMVHLRQPFFEELRSLLEQASRLPDNTGNGISMSKFQAGWWDELQKLGSVSKQAASWQSAVEGLAKLSRAKVRLRASVKKIPGLNAELRPYQAEGLAWLQFLREHSLGGVLADDMGLGKTVQSIALMVSAKKAASGKPFLVIAPTSVVENWHAEFTRFAPSLRVVVLRAGDRSSEHRQIKNADVVVVSYSILQRDWELLKDIDWDTAIVDEAQFAKNHQSKSYSLLRQLRADCKIALSGTPMENSLMELWSVFSIVAPGLFPPPERFKDTFQRPVEKGNDKRVLAQLRSRIKPFLLRRRKELVEKDLPEKNQQVLFLEMQPDQRKIYDLYLQRERQKVLGLLNTGGLKANRFEILTSLTRLRQLCLHPALVDAKNTSASSVKLDELAEQLATILAEGHKVLVFSQFTSFLALVRQRLDAGGTTYCYLDGSTKNRGKVVEKFQNDPNVKLFLISLKAGGTGLNLTAADYCFVLDPWWNPAVENQAIARIHRIGQTRRVFIYKFIVKNTIEEKVLKLQEKKQGLFNSVIEDGDAFSKLVTDEDIKALFE